MHPQSTTDPASASKRCSKCGEIKLPSAFHRCSLTQSGYTSACADCRNAVTRACNAKYKEKRQVYRKAYYEQHREAALAYAHEYGIQHREEISQREREYARDHPEVRRATYKRSYARHRAIRIERAAEYRRKLRNLPPSEKRILLDRKNVLGVAYRERNRDRIRKQKRAWNAAHLLYHAAIEHQRRARKRGVFVEKVDHLLVFERDRWRCGICGKKVKRKDATLDHIVPFAAGGEHSYRNVQCAHFCCNSRKGARGHGQPRLMA